MKNNNRVLLLICCVCIMYALCACGNPKSQDNTETTKPGMETTEMTAPTETETVTNSGASVSTTEPNETTDEMFEAENDKLPNYTEHTETPAIDQPEETTSDNTADGEEESSENNETSSGQWDLPEI